MKKKAIVIHSGGMDSSICLVLAVKEFGASNVLSLSFDYHQRHSNELRQAAFIANYFAVDHKVLSVDCLNLITENALTNPKISIEKSASGVPNTLVVGRNGLMAHLGAIHAQSLGAQCIFMGVIEVEGSNSGYRDCSRAYMDLMEQILRLDLADDSFCIRTPLVHMSKFETMKLADELKVLPFLWEHTITCYEGIFREGCKKCPACHLRNEGYRQFLSSKPQNVKAKP